MRRHFVTDLDECERLWNNLIRPRSVSDMWEFRLCFQRHFNRKPCFLVLEDRNGIAGMLPLSHVAETDMFVFFPGETWKGRTWNERTPIYARDHSYFLELLSYCPERTYLRYMESPEEGLLPDLDEDEIGYVLYPSKFDCNIAMYQKRFSNKKLKGIIKAIRSVMDDEGTFRFNRLEDFTLLVNMSLKNFGSNSYLYDYRFRESFRDIMHFLYYKDLLRMVSIEINGTTAAVDLGAVYRGTYTLFLGGTHPAFPGIAKAMNMHHVELGCEENLGKIDFLCGDFHWKKLWHLDAEPLYKFVSPELKSIDQAEYATVNDSVNCLSGDQTYA